MSIRENSLHDILRIGHRTSIRGEGLSLRDALGRTRYKDLRVEFRAEDLVSLIEKNPNFTEQWLAYSEDKRTSGGWYVLRDGEIGQVGNPESRVRFTSIEQAVAEYVVRELDYWSGFGSHAPDKPKGRQKMKAALWFLGSLLAVDILFLSYFYVIRADYYFPGRYEEAFAATLYALLFGLPVLCAFVVVLVVYRKRLRSSKS